MNKSCITFELNNDLYGENAHKATSIHERQSIEGMLKNLGDDATVFVRNENTLNKMLPGNQILKSLELLANVEHVEGSISQASGDVKGEYSISDNGYTDYDKPITVDDIRWLREIAKAHGKDRVSINEFTSEDIQKAQKWAYKFYHEIGTKSPFFRAWFGDWRANDKSKYEIVYSSGETYGGAGNAINEDTGKKISWGDTVRGETEIHAVKDKISVQALGDIEKIIRNAVLFETELSSKTSKSKMENTAFMHSFYSAYEENGGVYLLKLYVEEALPNKGGDPFTRAYQLKDIEKIAELPNGVLLNDEGLTEDNSTIINSISDMYYLVKTYDKDFHAGNEVNPVLLNEDGKPRVFYHGTGERFTEFSFDEMNQREGSFFFAENEEDARGYGDNVYPVYLTGNKLADYDNQPHEFYQLRNKRDQVDYLKERGYDGWYADMDSGGWGEVSVFYPNQIKSATDNLRRQKCGIFRKNFE